MISRIRNMMVVSRLSWLLAFLFLSAVYLYAFPQTNVFYAAVVLLHVMVGVLLSVYVLVFLFRLLRDGSWMARLGWLLVAGSAGLGVVLIKIGALRAEWNWVYLHIALALTGCGVLFADWAGRKGWLSPGLGRTALRYAVCLLAFASLSGAAWYTR